MKTKGYKIVKMYVEEQKVLCDIAVFGENSQIIDDCQLCEALVKRVPYTDREKIDNQYGNELQHNFINDMLIIC